MLNKIKSKVAALAVLALVTVYSAAPAFAQQVYDFSSSTEETEAMVGPLTSAAFTIVFQAFSVLVVLALALMGAGWVWGRFKKFSGMGRKI